MGDALAGRVTGAGLTDVAVKRVGCLGLCAAGPLVEVPESGRLFERVGPDDLGDLVGELQAVRPGATPAPPAPFFARQVRVATENSGRVDPEDLDDYRARGGYRALEMALTELTPAEVVDQVVRSGLRGRGGAGYPTGLKWTTVAKAPGAQKYVICNADEGDPGAFMDRSVLESDPHRVLEGMAIAGYAVGASRGYVYCRAEYPLAVARLKTAIRLAGRAGLVGAGIADTPFEFHVELRLGAGAFVCGEETALIASVQGGRGTPRPRPPYPAVSGLWRSPTLINNVETFASIAPIVRNGGDWYAGVGTGTSKGTKVFALAGRVVNTGLPEVLAATRRALDWYASAVRRFEEEATRFGAFGSAFMGLVGPDATVEHYDGALRVVGADGAVLAERADPRPYWEYLGEAVEAWSFLKSAYWKDLGYPDGVYRVGPLARLNVADTMGTPLADEELGRFRARLGRTPASSFHYHQARLIEILFCLERLEALLGDPDILSTRVRSVAGINREEGIGVAEAPRGTLLHHYRVDRDGIVQWANLVIATGHNNLAMNRSVAQVARHYVKAERLTEPMLNRVEAVIRCYDPCLSCSTHAIGQMPLHLRLLAPDGTVLDERRR